MPSSVVVPFFFVLSQQGHQRLKAESHERDDSVQVMPGGANSSFSPIAEIVSLSLGELHQFDTVNHASHDAFHISLILDFGD